MVVGKDPQRNHPSWQIVQIMTQAFLLDHTGSGIKDINLEPAHIHEINGARIFVSKVDTEIQLANGPRKALPHLGMKGLGGKGGDRVRNFQQRAVGHLPSNMSDEDVMPLFPQVAFCRGTGA